MSAKEIESRVAVLEAEVARLKEQLDNSVPANADWLEGVYGAFADDPHFEEAMRLGREYRESLRPKPRRAPPSRPANKPAKRPLKGRSR